MSSLTAWCVKSNKRRAPCPQPPPHQPQVSLGPQTPEVNRFIQSGPKCCASEQEINISDKDSVFSLGTGSCLTGFVSSTLFPSGKPRWTHWSPRKPVSLACRWHLTPTKCSWGCPRHTRVTELSHESAQHLCVPQDHTLIARGPWCQTTWVWVLL